MHNRTAILESIRQIKRNILPDGKLILFGSQARGDANEDSDWDLLIILNKPQREFEDYDKYAFPFVKLGWETDELISPKIYTTAEWEKSKPSLFYKNIQAEGIEIA